MEDVPSHASCIDAAWNGDLARLIALTEHNHTWRTVELYIAAARNGRLEVLEWLQALDPPVPWPYSPGPLHWLACEGAAVHGHLEVLEWLSAHNPLFPWSANLFSSVASCGNLEVLQWLRAHGCPFRVFCRAAMISISKGVKSAQRAKPAVRS